MKPLQITVLTLYEFFLESESSVEQKRLGVGVGWGTKEGFVEVVHKHETFNKKVSITTVIT